MRGIRSRQCCLEIWTIPLKIFNPFISGQPRVSPSRPNRGMKGLGWLDASCAAILTSESWIEDTKYCQIIAPPFGNSFVQFLYRSCMGLFTFWIILTFHLHRMTVCFLTRFSYLPSFLRWSPSSPTTYRCWLSPLRCNGVGDYNNSSKVTTLHENTSAIFDTVSSSLFLRDGRRITMRRASMSVFVILVGSITFSSWQETQNISGFHRKMSNSIQGRSKVLLSFWLTRSSIFIGPRYTWWSNLELMQVEPHRIGKIWNQCKLHYI